MAFPLAAIGAGLGLGADAITRQREAEMRRAQMMLLQQQMQQQMQEDQRKREALGAMFGLFSNPGSSFTPAGPAASTTNPLGLTGPAMQMPQPSSFPTTSAAFTPRPATGEPVPGLDDALSKSYSALGGSGAASAGSGGGLMNIMASLGVAPDVASGAIEYMRRNESGLDPNAVNPTSGALGIAQWLGPRKAALTSRFGARPTVDQQENFIGDELLGPESGTLDALRNAKTAEEGYDIWGRNFERPGGAALAKAGVGGIMGAAADASKAAIGLRTSVDPMEMGRMQIPQLAKRIDELYPGLDPVVKGMALQFSAKMLAPDQAAALRVWMQENNANWRIALAEFQAKNAAERTAQTGGTVMTVGGKPYSIKGGVAKPVVDESGKPLEGDIAKIGSGADTGKLPADWTEAKIEFWANVLRNGGHLPPGISRTKGGSLVVQAIMQKMPEMAGSDAGNFIANAATVKADDRSLSNMTKMRDAAVSFERTASRNFDLALKLSKGAVPTDLGPFVNRWVMEGEKTLGDTSVPPYVTAMLTGANEYAKIMAGSTGAQGSTVDSRREAAELFSPYLSTGQINRVVAVAKADMANRKSSLDDQVDDIKARLRKAGSTKPTGENEPKREGDIPPSSASPGGPKEGAPAVGTVQNGYRFKGGDPADPKNWEKVQ